MKKSNILIIVLLLIAAAAGTWYFLNGQSPVVRTDSAVVAEDQAAVSETVIEETATTDTTTATAAPVDVAAILAERGLGDPNAPVRIDEYASLTCSHCADFNKETFETLKAEYIDTGKVYFVYNDFPLNAPALDASVVARCLPAAQFFPYIKFLFQTQNDWAFNEQYRQSLKQNAKLLGLSDEAAEACLSSEELKTAFVTQVQTAGQELEINSTPTFIINRDKTKKISGAASIDTFRTTIDALVPAGFTSPTAAPATATPASTDAVTETAPAETPATTESVAPAEEAAPASAETPVAPETVDPTDTAPTEPATDATTTEAPAE